MYKPMNKHLRREKKPSRFLQSGGSAAKQTMGPSKGPGPVIAALVIFLGSWALSSPIQESPLYKVWLGGQMQPVFKEICNDHKASGGQKTVHTVRFDHVTGQTIEIAASEEFSSPAVLPRNLKISPLKKGSKWCFQVARGFNYVFEEKGKEPLFLFGAPTFHKPPAAENVVIFSNGPVDVGRFDLQSDTTYFLSPQTILRGNVLIKNKKNIRFAGRGLIDNRTQAEGWRGDILRVYDSTNIELEGFGIRNNARGFQCEVRRSSNVKLAYLNLLSFGENNDGIDLDTGVVHFSARHCFIGSGDDGFGWHAIDAAANGENPTFDCEASDCLIWKNAIGVGIRIGSSLETSSLSQLRFRDIDIVHNENGYAIAIPHSDWALVSNVIFERIRQEAKQPFALVYIKKTGNSNPVYRPGRVIDLQFIECENPLPGIQLSGFDSTHLVEQVLFRNIKLAGSPLVWEQIGTNEFVRQIELK